MDPESCSLEEAVFSSFLLLFFAKSSTGSLLRHRTTSASLSRATSVASRPECHKESVGVERPKAGDYF